MRKLLLFLLPLVLWGQPSGGLPRNNPVFTGRITGPLFVGSGSLLTDFPKANILEASLFAADAGSNDSYVITLSPAITAYVTGTRYWFKANTANTGAATLNINGLGAKTIVKVAGGITTALADNDIRAGQWVDVVYDGTNMQMGSMLGNAASGSGNVTNSGTLTDMAIATGAGTTVVKTPSATSTLDSGGNVVLAGNLTMNGTSGIATAGSATGILTLAGATSGNIIITGVDAMAQTVTLKLAAQTGGNATLTIPDQVGANRTVATDTGTLTLTNKTIAYGSNTITGIPDVIQIVCSAKDTDIVAGTNVTMPFRMPWAATLTGVRASCSTASGGTAIIIDVNEAGFSVLSTRITIEVSETTSLGAASQPVISDSSLANDAVITIDFDQVGSSPAGQGVVVTLYVTHN